MIGEGQLHNAAQNNVVNNMNNGMPMTGLVLLQMPINYVVTTTDSRRMRREERRRRAAERRQQRMEEYQQMIQLGRKLTYVS